MNRRTFLYSAAALALTLGACSGEADFSLKHINAAKLKERIAVLANDSLEGRGPGTRSVLRRAQGRSPAPPQSAR